MPYYIKNGMFNLDVQVINNHNQIFALNFFLESREASLNPRSSAGHSAIFPLFSANF